MLDENEFLSPYGIRSLSRVHKDHPYVLRAGGERATASTTSRANRPRGMFGGNSNWRGPIWFPVNYLLIEALERYHHFYGDALQVECPTGSGQHDEPRARWRANSAARLMRIFLPDDPAGGPVTATIARFADDPHWRDLLLFHEYFHGDTGRGLGASHQTGWTALVTRLLEELRRKR